LAQFVHSALLFFRASLQSRMGEAQGRGIVALLLHGVHNALLSAGLLFQRGQLLLRLSHFAQRLQQV
jgi:hypothetical protein